MRNKTLAKLKLKIIFIYDDLPICQSMCSVFEAKGLVCYYATSIEEAIEKIKENNIKLIVVDIFHFNARCIMDFRALKENAWITAINTMFMDTQYYRAKEFGATWVTSAIEFGQYMPIFLRNLNRYYEFHETIAGY